MSSTKRKQEPKTPPSSPFEASHEGRTRLIDRYAFIGVMILAVAVKVTNFVILATHPGNPFFDGPIMDERYHHELARAIANGQFFPLEVEFDGRPETFIPYYRSPLYYYTLALVYKLFGVSFLAGRTLSLLAGIGIALLTYRIARRLWNPKVGLIAATIAIFSPMLLYFDFMLLTTNLETLLYLAGLDLLLAARETGRLRSYALAGLAFGLGALARPTILPFVALIALVLLFDRSRGFRRRLRALGALGLPVALTVFSVTAINGLRGGDFGVLVAWNGGINFFYGNHAEATGWAAASPRMDRSWWGGYREAIRIATERSGIEGRELKKSEVSSFWFKEGLRFVLEHPAEWASLMGRKFGYLTGNVELSNNQSIWGFRRFSVLLKNPVFGFATLLGLAILGMVLGAAKTRGARWLILYAGTYSLTILLFFVNARYRVPLLPVLAVLGGYGVWALFQAGSAPLKTGAVLAAILVGGLSLQDIPKASKAASQPHFHHACLGLSYNFKGNYARAAEAFEKALETTPRKASVLAYLAEAREKAGDFEGALRAYETLMRLRPTVDVLRRVVFTASQAAPNAPKTLFYRGLLAHREGRHAAALKSFEEIGEPREPQLAQKVLYVKAMALIALGRREEAREALERVSPSFLDRNKQLSRLRGD